MAFLHALEKLVTIIDDTGLYHFTQKVISFSCTLSNTGKYRKSVMFLCNIIDEFLDKYGLPHSLRSDFIRSCRRLQTQDIDIFLGNHVGNNDTIGKYKKMKETGENPFLNTNDEWQTYLRSLEKDMIDTIMSNSPDEMPADLIPTKE